MTTTQPRAVPSQWEQSVAAIEVAETLAKHFYGKTWGALSRPVQDDLLRRGERIITTYLREQR